MFLTAIPSVVRSVVWFGVVCSKVRRKEGGRKEGKLSITTPTRIEKGGHIFVLSPHIFGGCLSRIAQHSGAV